MSTREDRRNGLRRCGWLTLVGLGLAVLLAGPAYIVAGMSGLEGLLWAALLCLVPGWIVFLTVAYYGDGIAPVWLILGGTGLRLVFVLVGTLVILTARDNFGLLNFLVWLVIFYLLTLSVETWLLLKQLPD